MKYKSITLLIIFTLFVSCTKKTELENALEMAGANRIELEKVLTHYSKNPADSLKLRAAEFLISNMVYHHTFENKKLKAYYAELIKLNRDTSNVDNCHNIYDSLGVKYHIESKDLKIKYDIQTVEAKYLIKNIDQAIHHWYKNPWTQHLSFADFCEYILPYRLENENLEEWREKTETKYNRKIEWLENTDDSRNSVYFAARYLNEQLKNRGFNLYSYKSATSINPPPSVLNNIKLGNCENYAQSTIFIMRAKGIPVCIDFTPQWPNRSLGHTWNVLFDESGKEVPFMGYESSPGNPNRPGEVMAKVFRKTFSYQNESLFHINNNNEEIPTLFKTPYIKDVTKNYFLTVDVDVELFETTKNKFAYLAVFNNSEWVPVYWGQVKGGNKVKFNAMGKNCMYLPVIYNQGKCKSVGLPFFITDKAKVKQIKSHFGNKQAIYLTRKFPVMRRIYYNSRKIIGTVIEASNNPNFKDSIVVGEIERDPVFDWDTLRCNTKNKFRYWRLKGHSKSPCYISEFQFIFEKRNITDTAKTIVNISKSNINKPVNLFDNNKLTYIELKENSNEWIGIDFGKPVTVDYYRFLPRNDDNDIVAGDSYELMIWYKTGWKSLIKCVATSDKLKLRNVPSGGLYLLHNLTKGKEERIFTYENGKQVWW